MAKTIPVNIAGMLKSIEADGLESHAYMLIVYGVEDGDEPTVNQVRRHLQRLLAQGITTLPLDDPRLFDWEENYEGEENQKQV